MYIWRPWTWKSDDYPLVEDVGFSPSLSFVSELELVPIAILDDRGRMDPREILRQARLVTPHLGKDHAAWLMDQARAKDPELPTEFFHHLIVFPGTIWEWYGECFFFLDGAASISRGQPNGFFHLDSGYFMGSGRTIYSLRFRKS